MTTQPLSRDSAALVLADHQANVLEYVEAPPREEVEANVVRLARAAARMGMPLILTTSAEAQNRALLPALGEVAPDAYARRIERHGVIDALAEPRVAEAVAASGRRQLIMAGIGTEVCGVAPALHAQRDGYLVTFVADACGSPTMFAQEVSLRRLERDGLTLATTAMVVAELAGDYGNFASIMFG